MHTLEIKYTMKNFKQLKIWLTGMDIAVNAIKFTKAFPEYEKYGLRQQINRSAVSIPSNIAEGSSRLSDKDYHRYLEISLGSCFELETQILIAERVEYGDTTLKSILLTDIDIEQKMLIGFMNKLKN